MKKIELSKRARNTLELLLGGKFYPSYDEYTPKAMKELVDAGLVGHMGRVGTMISCYAPVGSAPLRQERFPKLTVDEFLALHEREPHGPDPLALTEGAMDQRMLEQIVKEQGFSSFDDWVNNATRMLTAHPQYNDVSHGKTGYRGDHFKAICFDAKGRRCTCGADFMRARDEDAFPVRWLWPNQIGPLFISLLPPS